ncbi:MAG TPA: class I SAM-dependent methyltransferase, partial [Burkholderiaceae bacterium]|nr:class I SAM-dependent methyltransferase [Burkholderiaceae bacterium]
QPAWRRACFSISMRVRHAIGLVDRLPTPDRALLEDVILAHYARRDDVRRVLFVGCDWYTRRYERLFTHADYWTLERDPRRARYGARRHVVDSLEHMSQHFPPRSLDLIVCNGVFGWGLNARSACEYAFAQCHDALRHGGEFVLGWNDVPAYRPCDPHQLTAVARFEPIDFAPLHNRHRIVVPGTNRHTYDFFKRR